MRFATFYAAMNAFILAPEAIARVLRQGCVWATILSAAVLSPPSLAEESDAAPRIGAHGLSLPASFLGTLPCGDCEGISHHLDLWPDQSYHLRREWLGKPEDTRLDEIGRWYAAPELDGIVLVSRNGEDTAWQIKGANRLRLLDIDGTPIESTLPYDLTSGGKLSPTELSLPLSGMFLYYADSAAFRACITGRGFPVSEDAGYMSLQRAYVQTRVEPLEWVLVTLDATIAERPVMEGPDRPSLVVEGRVAAWPGETCAQELTKPPLTNSYWLISSLLGETLEVTPEMQEPYLLLLDGDEPRFAATVGCNLKVGNYQLETSTLRFPPPAASTMMACPPALDGIERRLDQVLAETASFRRGGHSMTLHNEVGDPIATLEAAYAR